MYGYVAAALSARYREVQEVLDRVPSDKFIRGGYWNSNSMFFIWIETIHSLAIWENAYDPQTYQANWHPTFVIEKTAPLTDHHRNVLSTMKAMAGVNTDRAVLAKTPIDAINDLIKALEAGGYKAYPSEKIDDLKKRRKKEGVCPECGDKGEWRMLALFCKIHGRFAG